MSQPKLAEAQTDQKVFEVYDHHTFEIQDGVLQHIFTWEGKRQCLLSIPLSSLQKLVTRTTNGFTDLLLIYEKAPGKVKKYKFSLDPKRQGFQDMVAYLVDYKPDIDTRNLSPKEISQLMGRDYSTIQALILPPLMIVLIIAIFTGPVLIHSLDTGHEKVSMTKLSEGYTPDSRNLTVTGVTFDRYVRSTVTTDTKTRISYVLPMLPAQESNAPIRYLLQTGTISKDRLETILNQSTIKGVVQNVWWEGPNPDHIEYMTNKMKLQVSEKVVLIAHNADPQSGLKGTLITMVLAASGMFFFMLYCLKDMKKEE